MKKQHVVIFCSFRRPYSDSRFVLIANRYSPLFTHSKWCS
jgi:hypothetical protein